MRTTVDLDKGLLGRAKQLALKSRRSLSAVVNDSLAVYLGSRGPTSKDGPFELLVCGRAGARFPSPGEIASLEEEEDAAALSMPRSRRRASP